jgi:hypothetical protein
MIRRVSAFFNIACPRAPCAMPETIRNDELSDAPPPEFPPMNIMEEAINIILITTNNSIRVKALHLARFI